MRVKYLTSLSYVLFLVILFSCKKDMNDQAVNPVDKAFNIPASNPVTGRITGIVVDEHNTPVQDATVQLGGLTATTDVKGYFYFQNAQLDKYVTTVIISKAGYFKALRSFSATASRNYLSIKLIPKILSGTIDAATGGAINLSNGTTITFPSNGVIVKSSGAAYQGTVNVYASYIDPTAGDFANIVPGSMMGKDAEHMYILQSTGMVAVDIEDTNGQPLQLAAGKTAAIHLSIPSSLQSKAPATINTWSLNDQGIWQQEGTATKNGNFYDLNVSHFSFWNTDAPVNVVYLTIHVQDQAGNALPNLAVQLHVPNNTTWWATTYGITDSTGTVAGLVPADLPIEMTAIPNNYYCTSPVSTQNIGPFTADTTVNMVVTLSSTQQVTVTGTATDCNNQPLVSGYAVINLGPFNQYNVPVVNGAYSLTTAYCTSAYEVNVTVYEGNGTGAFTHSGNQPVTGNIVSFPSLQVCGLSQVAAYDADGLWPPFNGCVVGEPLNASHYLPATFVVYEVGTYNISLQSNGMTFAASGYFPHVGRDTVYLLGSGTPQTAGFTLLSMYGFPSGPGVAIDLFAYAPNNAQAAYTINGPNYCSNKFVEGLYITGQAVDLSNTVTMLVNVSSTGRYSISTDPVNGVQFTATGLFTHTGNQFVHMNATGTPQSAGVNTYQVTGVSDACSFNVNSFSPGTMATYDLEDPNGFCINHSVHGQFLHGAPLTDQDYVDVDVNVITPGAYYISTSYYDDFALGACGIFTNTGLQTIRLQGYGLPLSDGNVGTILFMLGQGNADPYIGGYSCSFEIAVH